MSEPYHPALEALQRSPLALAMKRAGYSAQQAADEFEREIARLHALMTEWQLAHAQPIVVKIDAPEKP